MYHTHVVEIAGAFKPLTITAAGVTASSKLAAIKAPIVLGIIKISPEMASNLGTITLICSSTYAVGKLALFLYELYRTFKSKRKPKIKQ